MSVKDAGVEVTALPILEGIERLPLAVAMRESFWLYPTVESLHIAGIAGLFGTVLLLDLRLLGLGRGVLLSPLIRLVVPVSLASLVLVVLTGSLMFLAHAREFVALPLFVYKIGFIMLLLTNAAVLHLRAAGHSDDPRAHRLGGLGHIQVALSIFGWLCVIGMGRWLAYV
ncbi:MAG: hypothetical protein ACO3FM_05395 [Burkholderiaceae bacterium]